MHQILILRKKLIHSSTIFSIIRLGYTHLYAQQTFKSYLISYHKIIEISDV